MDKFLHSFVKSLHAYNKGSFIPLLLSSVIVVIICITFKVIVLVLNFVLVAIFVVVID